MAQSKTAPALDTKVKELHEALVAVLGGRRQDEEPGEPYWKLGATTFQDHFKGVVANLLKSYEDQSADSPGAYSRSAAKRSSG